jgi:hypothetical protein
LVGWSARALKVRSVYAGASISDCSPIIKLKTT